MGEADAGHGRAGWGGGLEGAKIRPAGAPHKGAAPRWPPKCRVGGRAPPRAPADPRPEGALSDLFDLSELLGDFRDEARDPVARLDAALAGWERGEPLPEEERTVLLRGLHTLKGNAGMLGLRPIQDWVHGVESVLKRSAAPPAPATLRELLRGAAALRLAVDRAGGPGEEAAFAALVPVRDEPAEAEGPAPPPVPAEAPAAPGEVRAEDLRDDVVRIPFRMLDVLLDEISEVVTELTALDDWAEAHRDALGAVELRRALQDRIESLAAGAEAARRTATDLRMVPVGRTFSRYPALVRDLAREQGKRVRVVLEGEDTQLDKSTADALGEPLLHLVRNAVDHGIETPEEREAAGKPPEATLLLRAAQEGDRVRIEVEDDGRGLDRERIVARAREQGFAAGEEEAGVEELIFRPGFSTRRVATALSGRGIGLDAVRGAVGRLRGSVEVEPGDEGGTRFVLRLPLTVALVPALFFEAAGERLALPVADVEETLRAGEVERVGPAEVVRVREEVLPLVRPGRVFGWEEGDGARPRFVLVVRSGGRAAAVGADRLLDQRQATVRALPVALGSPPGVSGATVAPDGGVVLVLDPAAVVELNVDLYRGGGGGQ
ncbi:MAG TPA: chemotaxis protein CheW [Longimicrobiaceae bacterium]|nr:chemotaxis protein CheW [Longimicrobiaceae bacterium]